jgi:hypothetical protein
MSRTGFPQTAPATWFAPTVLPVRLADLDKAEAELAAKVCGCAPRRER